jgi:RNase P subunit RPR2
VSVTLQRLIENRPFMEPYFIVLEMPESGSHSTEAHNWDKNLCSSMARSIEEGNAKVISVRNDTGISEELRSYACHIKKFTTFLILQVNLSPGDFRTTTELYKKIKQWLCHTCNTHLVHSEDNYELISVEAA